MSHVCNARFMDGFLMVKLGGVSVKLNLSRPRQKTLDSKLGLIWR